MKMAFRGRWRKWRWGRVRCFMWCRACLCAGGRSGGFRGLRSGVLRERFWWRDGGVLGTRAGLTGGVRGTVATSVESVVAAPRPPTCLVRALLPASAGVPRVPAGALGGESGAAGARRMILGAAVTEVVSGLPAVISVTAVLCKSDVRAASVVTAAERAAGVWGSELGRFWGGSWRSLLGRCSEVPWWRYDEDGLSRWVAKMAMGAGSALYVV